MRDTRQLLQHNLSLLLSGNFSVDLVVSDELPLFVFAGDWLHQNIGPYDKGLTMDRLAQKVRAGKLCELGQWPAEGRVLTPDQRLFVAMARRHRQVNLVDCGANYSREGIKYALLARRFAPSCSVRTVSVEPGHAGLLGPLNYSLHSIPEGEFVQAALSHKSGIDLFYFKTNVTTGGTMLPNLHQLESGLYRSVPVRVTTLDEVVAEWKLKGPTFLKIDLQGAEYDMLRGAGTLFSRDDIGGVLEFSPLAMQNRIKGADFLAALDRFDLYDLGLKRDKLRKLGPSDFASFAEEVKQQEKPWTDILFCQPGFVDWLE